MENEPVTVYRAAQIFRKFLFNYRDQLHASIIIAGCDDKKGGQVFIYKKFHKCFFDKIDIFYSTRRIYHPAVLYRVRKWRRLFKHFY